MGKIQVIIHFLALLSDESKLSKVYDRHSRIIILQIWYSLISRLSANFNESDMKRKLLYMMLNKVLTTKHRKTDKVLITSAGRVKSPSDLVFTLHVFLSHYKYSGENLDWNDWWWMMHRIFDKWSNQNTCNVNMCLKMSTRKWGMEELWTLKCWISSIKLTGFIPAKLFVFIEKSWSFWIFPSSSLIVDCLYLFERVQLKLD